MYTLVPYRRNQTRDLSNSFGSDRFFRSFFDMSDMMGSAGFRVDVHDNGESYILEAELPGITKEKINLSIDESTLTISADLNAVKKEEHRGYLYSERRTGHVERRFTLEGIREDDITANYENGVLLVELPKVQPKEMEREPRTIDIR